MEYLTNTEFAEIGFTLKGKEMVFVKKLKIITKTVLYAKTRNTIFLKIEYKFNSTHLIVIVNDEKKKVKFEFDKR